MPNFTDKLRAPFTSRRVRDVPPPDAPPANAFGGWSPAADAAAARGLDPIESEREQRAAGAAAIARMQRDDDDRRRADMERRLGNAPRGRNYG